MVPFVVELTVEGGVTVPLVVTLIGKGGVARARADDRVMKKVRVCRVNFIVTVSAGTCEDLEGVEGGEGWVKEGEIILWVGIF